MWLTSPNRIGVAAWQVGDSVWRVLARGGEEGVSLPLAGGAIRLEASSGASLPTLDEQFVRGDELHLAYPQAQSPQTEQSPRTQQSQPEPAQAQPGDQFGFRLVVRPVRLPGFETDAQRAIFELLVSVQTTLLDSHPTLDLTLPSGAQDAVLQVDEVPAAVHRCHADGLSLCVLLSPQDAPFTTRLDRPDRLSLRLFGEFLEKGVIRRARPWIIVHRSAETIKADWATTVWRELAGSPLPLR